MLFRILLITGILAIVAVIVFFAVPWGEYKSDINKSELTDTVRFSVKENNVPPSLDQLEGHYTVSKKTGTAEVLFNTKGLKTTKGGFDDFVVHFNVPADYKQSSLEVIIETASLNTGNETRDEHLQEAEFFHAEKFPQILFASNSIELGDTSYIAKGQLTLNGITKNLDVPFLHLGAGGEGDSQFEAFEGAFEIDRTTFGQEESSGVGNIVKITFYCELRREST